MEIREEVQLRPVQDEVSAITAVVGPILKGVLYSIKAEVAAATGGYDQMPLFMLARNHRPGDGDAGICFEYAIHEAIRAREPSVMERITDALAKCRVTGGGESSILFGVEKSGSQGLIETAESLLTPESLLMPGGVGRPPKLKRHIASAATAFRTRGRTSRLPQSIDGLWKADLFVGSSQDDRWVGTSVKINPSNLSAARGLRIGIVPTTQGRSDRVYQDDNRNLIVCPLPYDGAFVETFYMAWEVVRAFLAADAHLPREVALPRPAARQVARYLADRRAHPVVEVIEALLPLAQPELLRSHQTDAEVIQTSNDVEMKVNTVLAPHPSGLTE